MSHDAGGSLIRPRCSSSRADAQGRQARLAIQPASMPQLANPNDTLLDTPRLHRFDSSDQHELVGYLDCGGAVMTEIVLATYQLVLQLLK